MLAEDSREFFSRFRNLKKLRSRLRDLCIENRGKSRIGRGVEDPDRKQTIEEERKEDDKKRWGLTVKEQESEAKRSEEIKTDRSSSLHPMTSTPTDAENMKWEVMSQDISPIKKM